MFSQILICALAVCYASMAEWLIHKYILHGMGKRKGSFWSFHWHEHHRNSRKYGFFDPLYKESVFNWNARFKEISSIVVLLLTHVPVYYVAPTFVLTCWIYGITYLFVHQYSHLKPEWAKKWLPHHWDHHMGKDQDKNWCVLFPLFDWIAGTRDKG